MAHLLTVSRNLVGLMRVVLAVERLGRLLGADLIVTNMGVIVCDVRLACGV